MLKCSWCGKESDQLSWFPFALYLCPECTDKMNAQIEEERRLGEICLLCRQPRSLCVC